MSVSVSGWVLARVMGLVWVSVVVWGLVLVSGWVWALGWVRAAVTPHRLGDHLRYPQNGGDELFPVPVSSVGYRVRQDGPRFKACNWAYR